MAHIVFVLPDKSEVFLESDERPVGEQFVGRGAEELRRKFDESLGTVRKMAEAVKQALDAVSPDEVEIEFGLKASYEVSGLLVAKAAAEGHYKVSLKWKKS